MNSVVLEGEGPPYRDLIRIAVEAERYYAMTASTRRRQSLPPAHTRAEIESYEAAKKNALSFISDILTARGVNVATVHIEPCPLVVDQDADHVCTYNGVPVFGARKSGYVMDEWRAQADRLCAPPRQAWRPDRQPWVISPQTIEDLAAPDGTRYMAAPDCLPDPRYRDL